MTGRVFTVRLVMLVSLIALLAPGRWAQAADKKSPAEERIDAASKAYGLAKAGFDSGTTSLDSVYLWSVRWLAAEREAGNHAAALGEHLKRMQSLESEVKRGLSTGMRSALDRAAARYYRAEAKFWIAKRKKRK